MHQRSINKKSKLVLATIADVLDCRSMHEDANCIEPATGSNGRNGSRGACLQRRCVARLNTAAAAGGCDCCRATRFRNAAFEIGRRLRTKRRKRHALPRRVSADETRKRPKARASLQPPAAHGGQLERATVAAYAARRSCIQSSRHSVGAALGRGTEVRDDKRHSLAERAQRVFVRAPNCGMRA